MRILPVLAALLAACSPLGTLSRTDGFRVPSDDTGTPDDDTAPDDTGDSGDPPGPTADLSTWSGTRVFSYQFGDYACDWGTDTATESGPRVVEGDRDFATLQAACPECTAFFRVAVEPDEVCGWISLSTVTFRGLAFGEDTVAIWRLDEEPTLLDAAGTWDGFTSTYAYESVAYYGNYEIPLEIEGAFEFPVKDATAR